jgi:cytochrome c
MTGLKIIRISLGTVVAVTGFVAVTSVIPTPLGRVKAVQPKAKLFEGLTVDAEAKAILDRACLDCHSDETRWPWYSSIAPASWLVERDVLEARKQLNFSRWPEYGSEGERQLLGLIGEYVEAGVMPPGHYRLMHPEARLTAAERDLLTEWTRTEAERINTLSK